MNRKEKIKKIRMLAKGEQEPNCIPLVVFCRDGKYWTEINGEKVPCEKPIVRIGQIPPVIINYPDSNEVCQLT